MHSISPYSVRCFNKNGPKNDKYCVLNKVGSKDALVVLHDFISSHNASLVSHVKTKQAYIFSNINFDAKERKLSGWFNVGSHGMASDILNIKTGNKDFVKTIDNADMVQHYFQFHFPLNRNEGLCCFHSYRGRGVKTLFSEIFAPYFLAQTSLNMQFNPLAYEKAFQPWVDANVKELHITKFTGLKDIADASKKMGHCEAKLILTPDKQNKFFGKFSDLTKKGSEPYLLVEHLSGLGSQTKTVVELNGKKRIFIVGADESSSVCQIELDDDLIMDNGAPQFDSMHSWVNDILSDYLKKLYPKKGGNL
jgi:hypothetical protein